MPSTMPDQLARPLTFEEWADLDEEVEGELVDGQLVAEDMPSFLHEFIVTFLATMFRNWLGPGRGAVGGSSGKFRVTPTRGRIPDLFVYFAESKRPLGSARVTDIPPDIMVEIVSEQPRDQRRDRVEKLAEYARFGVPYYWLVDANLRSVQILERGEDGRYVHAADLTEGRLDAVPGCPDLVLDVDALWAEVDRLNG